jgi:N-acetylmuramate 1-kinase
MTLYSTSASKADKITDTQEFINLHKFLQNCNIKQFTIYPLPQDASKRKYYRINDGEQNYIVMDSSQELESFTKYLKLNKFLYSNNITVPEIYNAEGNGYALLQDFGGLSINQYLLQNPCDQSQIYTQMVDIIIQLQTIKTNTRLLRKLAAVDEVLGDSSALEHAVYLDSVHEDLSTKSTTQIASAAELPKKSNIELKKYDDSELNKELQQFLQHYAFDYIKNQQQAGAAEELLSIFNNYSTLVHKDFHVDNLMLLNNSTKENAIGVLDFQDAILGSPAYDLVSLLQDARRFVDAEFESQMKQYYLEKTGHNKQQFTATYDLLGLQKNFKIVGIFNRIYKQHGHLKYHKCCPTVWQYIERALNKPEFFAVAAWMKKYNIEKQI